MNGVRCCLFQSRWCCLLSAAVCLLALAFPAAAAYRVTSLQCTPVSTGAVVTLEADAPIQWSSFTMDEPESHLVVDIFDAVHALPQYHFRHLGTPFITRIRTSQYRPYPQPKMRVVLDLPQLMPFQISGQENRLIISLQEGPGDYLASPEPRPAAAAVTRGEAQKDQVSPEQEAGGQEGAVALSHEPQAGGEGVGGPGEEQDQSPREATAPVEGRSRAEEDTVLTPPQETSAEGSGEPSQLIQEDKTAASQSFILSLREPVSYSSGSRRDPFVPLPAGQEVEFGQAPLPDVDKTAIVGILQGVDGYRALAQDNEGNGYVLRKGDQVLYGYVARIEKERVVFRLNRRGLDRTVILKLPQ